MFLNTLIRRAYHPMIRFPQRGPSLSGRTIKLANLDALNLAIKEELERDEEVFVIGEEVSQETGSSSVTRGLRQKFGEERVKDTPVSEAALTGLVCGSALLGLKPIIQYETMVSSLKGIDHIVNSCAKLHYMSGGELNGGAIVFRGVNGITTSSEGQESHCLASYYSNLPGLVTLAPYDAEDCRGLLKAAIRHESPVVFLQNESIYYEQFTVPEQVMYKDFIAPIGKARVMRKGKDVTLVAFGINVKYALEAAEIASKKGIDCEVINLRSLRPLDRDTIVDSVIKTGRIISVEDGYPQSGVGAEIVALVSETVAFDYLKGPVQRVTAVDAPIPYAKKLSEAATPSASTISKAITKVYSFK